jgi:outer membrane protein TolC
MARLALSITAALVAMLSTLARAADQKDLPKRLTLSQAITIALSNNSILRTAQSRLDQTSGRYAQSRSPLLPQLEPDARRTILLRSAGT